MNKYEQLLEHIINDESEKASELFHTIVVEQSRDIYESLIDEEDLAEVGGNEVEDLANEVMADEEGISEEEDDFSGDDEFDSDDGDEEFDSEDGDEIGDEMAGDEFADEESVEDRVVDLETALDDLKAEFDALMAGDDTGEEVGDEMAGDEFADEDGEEVGDEMAGDEFADEDGENEFMREYVEKVTLPSKTEGGEVGKGGTATVNKQSIVAKKNDMGGTASNIVKGGTENSKSAKKPQDMNTGNINVPGGKAGKSSFKTKQSPKTAEGETTDGKSSVDTKSLIGKTVR